MVRAAGWPKMSSLPAPPRTTQQEGPAMTSPLRRVSNALKLERSCELSRLQAQALAAAYELATPLLRCPIPNTAPGQQSPPGRAPQADWLQRQAGGRQA